MPCSAFRILTLALSLAAVCASGMAGEAGIAAKLHPWGRFDPGAWRLVRVVTETLDEQGEVVSTSTTDTRTTLVDIDNDGITLEIQACMEVAGKRFQAEPQIVKQGFHGELAGLTLKSSEPEDGQLVVEDRKIACKIRQLEVAGPSEKANIRLSYSTTVWPYLLKRECVASNPEGKRETNLEVIALDMPVRVQEDIRSGAYVKTVSKNGKGTVTTLATMAPEVPGGVVSHSLKEVDKSGRVVRRSTFELRDYSAHPDEDRSGLFRKHSSRRTKSGSR
jgi:hypothetical protein